MYYYCKRGYFHGSNLWPSDHTTTNLTVAKANNYWSRKSNKETPSSNTSRHDDQLPNKTTTIIIIAIATYIASVIPQVGSGGGSVYANLTPTLKGREIVSDRHSTQNYHDKYYYNFWSKSETMAYASKDGERFIT